MKIFKNTEMFFLLIKYFLTYVLQHLLNTLRKYKM